VEDAQSRRKRTPRIRQRTLHASGMKHRMQCPTGGSAGSGIQEEHRFFNRRSPGLPRAFSRTTRSRQPRSCPTATGLGSPARFCIHTGSRAKVQLSRTRSPSLCSTPTVSRSPVIAFVTAGGSLKPTTCEDMCDLSLGRRQRRRALRTSTRRGSGLCGSVGWET